MRIDFTTEVRDPDFGFSLNETDFQIEAELSGLHDGRHIVDVTQVWLDGVDLLASNSPLARSVASIVTTAAEGSAFIQKALRDGADKPSRDQVRRLIQRREYA